jgi:predicted aspartyl protease
MIMKNIRRWPNKVRVLYIRMSVGLLVYCLAFLSLPLQSFANDGEMFPSGQPISFQRLEGGQYTIDTFINGEGPFRFMIDTGASRTSIFEKTKLRLAIENQIGLDRFVNGMTGAEIRPTAIVRSMQFADQNFSDHLIVVLDDWSGVKETLDGILGMDVLAGLVFSFKQETQQVNITRGMPLHLKEYRKWARIKLSTSPYPGQNYGLPFTRMKFRGKRIPTLLDIGSGFSAVSWNTVEKTKLGKEKKRMKEEWVIHGAIGEFKPELHFIMTDFVIGGLNFKQHDLIVMEFAELSLNDNGKRPLVLLGVDILKDHDFILDFDRWQLLINARYRKYRERNTMRAKSDIDASVVAR